MGGVTSHQHPAVPVGGGLPRHVREPGDPGRASKPEVRPPHGDERLAKLVQVGFAGVVDVSFHDQHPKGRPVRGRTERMGADAVVTEAELRFPVHLDLGDHPAGRGIQPDEVDAGGLADQAASAVASDEVLRSERGVVVQVDVDASVVLRAAHDLAAAEDRDLELTDPVGQDRLEQALPQREHVVVAGGEVADVEADPAVPVRGEGGSGVEEPLRDATLIEHLDGPRQETPGARAVDVLVGASFDDDDVDPRQRQLTRQHQPRRAASCDHHRMLGHASWSARLGRLQQAPSLALGC